MCDMHRGYPPAAAARFADDAVKVYFMATRTIENYLKQLYLEQQETGNRAVPLGRVAARVGVTAGTATTMIKAIAHSGLARYAKRSGVRLTKQGEELAMLVLRRHRIVELFLVRIMEMDWADVHEEAEELEHVISDRVLEKMDAMLNHPQVDPHGDPIPDRQGRLGAPASCARHTDLAQSTPGRCAKVTRVLDQSSTFLKFAQKHGLAPGAAIKVVAVDPHAQSVAVESGGFPPVTLSFSAAAKFELL